MIYLKLVLFALTLNSSQASIERPVLFSTVKIKVFDTNCLKCHHTGNTQGITPLQTFETVTSVRELLEPLIFGIMDDVVVPPEQRMPPPKSPLLNREQKALVLLWLEDGAREK